MTKRSSTSGTNRAHQQYAYVLDCFGEAEARQIGAGSSGRAYLLSNGRVMKITRDVDEARSMATVAKHPWGQIVHVYGVYSFRGAASDGGTLYAIEQERLHAPTPLWAKLADKVGVVLARVRPRDARGPFNIHGPCMGFNTRSLPVVLANVSATLEQGLWLRGIAEYFDRVGIQFCDFHEGNIMRSETGHKLIDLGASIPPKAVRIKAARCRRAG